jgi:hypothetical protein
MTDQTIRPVKSVEDIARVFNVPAKSIVEVNGSSVGVDYQVGDHLVSHLSGYVYKIVDVDRAERRVKFAAAWDPEDAGWESFEDVASTFRHVPAGGVE